MCKLAVVAVLAVVAAAAGGWARPTVAPTDSMDHAAVVDVQALQAGTKDLPVWDIDSFL